MADKNKAAKATISDLTAMAMREAFVLADKDPFNVWVATRKNPKVNIGYVEAIDDDGTVTIGVEGKGHFERSLKSLVLYKQPKKKDKPLVYPPIHNSLYTVEHVHDLIGRAIETRKMRDQHDGDSAFSSGADYHFRLAFIVELLENITVFNIGDGANGFRQSGKSVGPNLSDRLDSFVVAFNFHSAMQRRRDMQRKREKAAQQ